MKKKIRKNKNRAQKCEQKMSNLSNVVTSHVKKAIDNDEAIVMSIQQTNNALLKILQRNKEEKNQIDELYKNVKKCNTGKQSRPKP